MDPFLYRERTADLLRELKDFLTLEEVEELYELLKRMGEPRYKLWFLEHLEEIKAFAGMPPSRRKKKKWQSKEQKLLTVVGAMHLLMMAWDVFDLLIENQGVLYGGSYREVAVQAGTIYAEIYGMDFPDSWLFDYAYPFSP